MSVDVQEMTLDSWMTVAEAAAYLGVSKQAVGYAALHHGIMRMRIEQVILLYRADVARYRATRQKRGRRGPRQMSADQ